MRLQVVVQSGNDAVIQVKGNQPTLLQTVETLAAQSAPSQSWHHDEIGKRNRVESGKMSVWPIAAGGKWPHVRSLNQVRRHTEIFNTKKAAWQARSEKAWYVCTREELSAREAHDAVSDDACDK